MGNRGLAGAVRSGAGAVRSGETEIWVQRFMVGRWCAGRVLVGCPTRIAADLSPPSAINQPQPSLATQSAID